MTPADIKSALTALPALSGALQDILKGTVDLSDFEIIGNDVLIGLGIADPALLPIITVVQWIAPIVLMEIAVGNIKPGTSGEGQTNLGQGGRRD